MSLHRASSRSTFWATTGWRGSWGGPASRSTAAPLNRPGRSEAAWWSLTRTRRRGPNMDLPLVYRIAKCCRQRQLASLRFNFRSVGESRGCFSGTEEYRDVIAAAAFMTERLDPEHLLDSEKVPLGLAGWSFGSVMAARAAADLPQLRALALVGFVVHWEHLPADTLVRLAEFRGPLLAVCAENDHHGSPEEVAAVLRGAGLRPRIEVIEGADHYLRGSERDVAETVAAFFAGVLGHE